MMGKLMNKKEVCELLNISRGSLDKIMKKKEIKYVKYDRGVRFRVDDVNEFIDNCVISK
jgi:excisionase family DNA binding protein